MAHLNVRAIVEHYKLDKGMIALLLFPDNKFPDSALLRVLNNDAYLNSEQIWTLSNFLGVSIDELYSFSDWQKQPPKVTDVVMFKRGEFSANLSLKNGTLTIYKDNKPINQINELFLTTISVKDLFTAIDALSANFK